MFKTRKIISKLIDILIFLSIFRSFGITIILFKAGISKSNVIYSRKTGIIRLKDMDINLNRKQHLFFFRGIGYAYRLKNECNAVFHLDENGKILVNIDGIEAFISTEGDLDIMDKIFFRDLYNITIDQPTVVLDVGMNVGFSALFFAKNSNVIVIGFEPFEMTFKQAISNIKRNNHLKDRIITKQYGLSGSNKIIRTNYSFELSRLASIYGFPKAYPGTDYDIEEIELRDVSEVIKEIKQKFANHNIVMKIDCEGSEYEIINSLYEHEELVNIHCLLMKWHIREPTDEPDNLVSQLKASNFVVLKTRNTRASGSLYAFRMSCIR